MREDDAALEEHLCEITETQLIAIAPEYNQTHDIRGVFEIVEQCASTFIKDTLTVATAKAAVT
jgi:hypothetical protein